MYGRIVLAYSGGLETTAAIAWLSEAHGAEIVTLTLDLGQGGDLDVVRQRALASGAARAHVLDARDEFALACVTHASPGAADSVRLRFIAQKLVEVAAAERAGAVAHGGEDADHEAMDAVVRTRAPEMAVLSPVRLWSMTRTQLVDYSRAHALPATPLPQYDVSATLWGRSIRWRGADGSTEDPPEDAYALTRPPGAALGAAARVDVAFEDGIPVAVNDVPMTLTELIESVATIAGHHGVGRVVDSRAGSAYEAPAAIVLHAARTALDAARPASATGVVRISLSGGQHNVVFAETQAPASAHHR